MMTRFNRWYDSVPSTPRFLLFLATIIVITTTLQVGILLEKPVLTVFGMVSLSMLSLIAMSRSLSTRAVSYSITAILGSMMALTIFLVFT